MIRDLYRNGGGKFEKKIWIQSVMYFAVVFLTAQISGVIAYQTDEASMCNRFVPGWNESGITEEFPEPEPVIPGRIIRSQKR